MKSGESNFNLRISRHSNIRKNLFLGLGAAWMKNYMLLRKLSLWMLSLNVCHRHLDKVTAVNPEDSVLSCIRWAQAVKQQRVSSKLYVMHTDVFEIFYSISSEYQVGFH